MTAMSLEAQMMMSITHHQMIVVVLILKNSHRKVRVRKVAPWLYVTEQKYNLLMRTIKSNLVVLLWLD